MLRHIGLTVTLEQEKSYVIKNNRKKKKKRIEKGGIVVYPERNGSIQETGESRNWKTLNELK